MEWLTFEEFRRLLEQDPDDLVVLDLRLDARRVSFPIADAFVLPISANELMEILVWLPPNRSVVFYGADALCITSIEMSPSMEGSAPLYFLDESTGRLESA